MITLITGCMGSGKTARLIELAEQVPVENRLVLARQKCHSEPLGCYYLPKDMIESRNGKSLKCNKVYYCDKKFVPLFDNAITHIFIDEGQWIQGFSIANYNDLEGVDITVSLLDKDYTGREYDTFLEWQKVADKIEHLHAICAVTRGYADYSELLTDHESTRKEDYRAVCWDVFKQSKHCRI